MDFHTRNQHFEVTSKKKYNLSLKRNKYAAESRKNEIDKSSKNAASQRDLGWEDESSELSESQNIKLRVSDSFLVEDTQENVEKSLEKKKTNEPEIIVISDSSDEEIPSKNEWTRLKKGGSPSISSISKISSADSEDQVEKGTRNLWQCEKTPNNVTLRNAIRKCSMYTSDETASERDFQNFTNDDISPKSQNFGAGKIIPDSDESIFSLDRVRNVLTDNQRNIESLSSLDISERNPRKVPTFQTSYHKNPNNFVPSDKENSPESPNLTGNSKNRTGSLKKLNEVDRIIGEWRQTAESTKNTKNQTENVKKSSEISKKMEEWKKTPEFSNTARNQIGSLSRLKETNKKDEAYQKTPEFVKKQTPTFANLKESNKRLEDFRKTPESANIPKSHTTSSSKSKGSSKRYEISKILHERNENCSNIKNPIKKFNLSEKNGESSKISKEAPQKTAIVRKTPTSAKTLSNRDARKILRVIESKRAIYQSPREYKKGTTSEDSDCDESSKEETENNLPKNTANIISESESESENEIIRGSKVDLSKPYKTHVTRFLDPNMDSPDGMSERKKQEIARWLLTNCADTRSETSLSNIPPSDQNSPSSGNSSLDRLEMNYETPNNRDKLRKNRANENPKINHKNEFDSAKSNQNNRLNSTKSRQIPIDTYFKKNDDGIKILTPVATKKNVFANDKKTEDLEIEDCADILDNLYGKTWRAKVHGILPSSEPRKKNVTVRDKAVQTERKAKPRSKKVTDSSISSSPEEGFETFVKNLKPNLNSTKKPEKKKDRRKWTFIKDSSSSSESSPKSSGASTYLTALTNPRISNSRKIEDRPAPLSLNIRRAIAICDSDTSDDDAQRIDNRKLLSFSDNESDSNASDFDIPKKITTNQKIVTKTRKPPVSVSSSKITKTKRSFLESLSSTIPLDEAHHEAIKYRRDFKNTKEELCKYLYKMYNEIIFDNKLPSDMSIEWNVRMRGTAGFCYNKRSIKALGGVARSSRIVLATKILDTPDRLRDTLVHEMCHAAAWLINDVSDGHGPFWKAWASKAMKSFPELPEIKRCHDYKITTKFTYRCTGCGYSVGRHSKSLDVQRKRCGHCYGKFELLINKVTKSGKVETRTPVTKKPTGFALFVKENYSSVKKDRKGVPHKEVMQILGQQFSAIKITKKIDAPDDNDSVSND